MRAEALELREHELGGLEGGHPVEVGHLVERALERPLGRGAVVADDVVDERVVQDLEFLEGIDDPADVEVGVLEEAGVDLHLPLEHRSQLRVHLVPRRDLGVPRRELRVLRDDPELLLAGEGQLPLAVPAVGERALVLVGPLLRHVVGGMGGARGEVHEEGLVRHQRLLLVHPTDGPVGQVLRQVVALLRRLRRLDGRESLVQRRVVLVVLAPDEAVEVLEPSPSGGPGVERPHRRGLPHGHLVALAELRRRVAVQLQRHCERRHGVGADGALPRR